MSRIGKLPINIPSGVTVSVDDGAVAVNGSKGSLSQAILSGLKIETDGQTLSVVRLNDEATSRSNHGLMRTLINNMVIGVSQGFERKLEVNGVGFKVSPQGNGLKLSLGYSHDINFTLPAGITANVEQNVITVSGIDKQHVGQIASEILIFPYHSYRSYG